MNKKIAAVVFILLAAILLISAAMAFLFYSPNTNFKVPVIKLDKDSFSDGVHNFAYRRLQNGEGNYFNYKTVLNKEQFDKLGKDEYVIVIHYLNCEAYKVVFNGYVIGTVGDYENGKSNIWNSINSFNIDSKLIKDSNELEIQTRCSYITGISNYPVFITAAKNEHFISGNNNFLDQINVACVSFGMLAALIVFLLFITSAKQKHKYSYFYFSLALLFLSIYSIDFTNIYLMPFSYLLYKKIIMISLFVCIYFFSKAVFMYFNTRMHSIVSLLILIGFFWITVFPKDIITYKLYYDYYILLVPFNIVLWIYVMLTEKRKKQEAKVFLAGSVISLVFSGYNIVLGSFDNVFVANTTLVYMLTMVVVTLYLVYVDFYKLQKDLETETQRREIAYKNAVTDGLTELYNQYYAIIKLRHVPSPFSIAMIDIDDFKGINDNYGHHAGDTALKFLASMLNKSFPEDESTFRYGGDEFLVLLKDVDIETAKKKVEDFRKNVQKHECDFKGIRFNFTISAGLTDVKSKEEFEEILSELDMSLQYCKTHGKNQIKIYSNDLAYAR